MARIIRKGRDLEREYNACKKIIKNRLLIAGGILCVAFAVFAVLVWTEKLNLLPVLPVAFGVAEAGFLLSIAPLKSKLDILKAGIMGEEAANGCVKMLPDSYTAFRNLTVFYEGRKSELDFLIVGPTGLFVVEVKNLNGSVRGRIDDKNWVLHKVGRGGTPYSKTFYNPVKQVNTHVYRTANCLRRNGVQEYVSAAVYFSNADSPVSVVGADPKTPVFSAEDGGARKMLEHIVRNDRRLTQEDCKRIVARINKM